MTPRCQLCRQPLTKVGESFLPQTEGNVLPATTWKCANEKCGAHYDGCVTTLPASRFPGDSP